MTASKLKHTPIYEIHKSLGAKMVPFGEWEMPIQYQGVLAEHKIVRESCGIFDVSHMGEVFVSGPDATRFLQYLTINNVEKLQPGSGQYTAMLNENGGMVDDLIAYQIAEDSYLLCVNAANDQKDFDWIEKNSGDFNVSLKHDSENWGQIALQGPSSKDALAVLFSGDLLEQIQSLDYMKIVEVTLEGQKAYVARTGYTGEVGYEFYLPKDATKGVFEKLLEVAKPIGLGARDTLRLEACYLLYGNDMNDEVSPIEAGIGWATRMDCGDFIGKATVEKHKQADYDRRVMIAFTLTDKGIARSGMDIYVGDSKIGVVTSGGHLPTLGVAGGMALVKRGSAKAGDQIAVDIRGKRKLAKVAKKPLYSAKVK